MTPPASHRRGAGGSVLTCGTFDLPHFGHWWLLRRARGYGDRLVVGVHDGSHGKAPILTLAERIETVISTGLADAVIGYHDPLALVELVRPDRIVQGDDWWSTGPDRDLIAARCEVILLPRTAGISTSDIKTRIREAT